MKFINLTPHEIRMRHATTSAPMGASQDRDIWYCVPGSTDSWKSGWIETVQPSGTVARISTTASDKIHFVGGVACVDPPEYGEPIDLPEPQEDTIYLVSALFIGRVGDRTDVYCPATGPNDGVVRLPSGQIYFVTRLIRC